jgi:putative lipoic acid-binding regulatory protein
MSKPTSALIRISIQETQTLNYDDSRRDSHVMDPRALDTERLRPSPEVCAKNRSSTSRTSDADDILQHPAARALQDMGKPSDDVIRALRHLQQATSKTSDVDDILQHPAARALQIMGKSSEDITRALRHLQQAGESLSDERLLELVTSKTTSASTGTSIQESQILNYGDSRRDFYIKGPQALVTGLSPSEVCAKNSSNTSGTSNADDILQHPAARALQVMGKPPEDIIRALRHLQQLGEPIIAERLLELVTSTTGSAITSLLNENKRLKMKMACKVCLRADVQTLFLPCRHLPCCEKCTPSVTHCPVCKRFILATAKTYSS